MKISGFNHDQSMQLVADQFEIEVNGSQPFIDANRLELVTLRHGLLDAVGEPSVVEHITAGVVDEVELHGVPDRLTSVIRGRDAGYYAVETSVYVTYRIGGTSILTSTLSERFTTPPAGGAPGAMSSAIGSAITQDLRFFLPLSLRPIPGVTTPLFRVGFFMASAICVDLAAMVGLQCSYQAPDYRLREDFSVHGSVIDAIRSLVAPFSQFEATKVDIYVDGTTLVIRERKVVMVAPALNTFSVHDARITNLTVRTRFLDYIRSVHLIGGSFTNVRRTNNTIFTFNEDVTTVDVVEDADGNTVSRIIETTTTRHPDGALLRQQRETFGANDELAQRVVTVTNWGGLEFDDAGRVTNSPKPIEKRTETTQFDPDGTETSTRETEHFQHDVLGFLTGQTATTVDDEGNPVSMTKKSYRDFGIKQHQIETSTFADDGAGGLTGTGLTRSIANGLRPGGSGRTIPTNAGGSGVPDSPPCFVNVPVDVLPGAKDFTYTNPNLLPAHLAIILAQARFMSGATEVEINFTAAGIPWLRRGSVIRLTGFLAEDGVTEISLPPALAFDLRTEYREGSANPTYLTAIKMVTWKK